MRYFFIFLLLKIVSPSKYNEGELFVLFKELTIMGEKQLFVFPDTVSDILTKIRTSSFMGSFSSVADTSSKTWSVCGLSGVTGSLLPSGSYWVFPLQFVNVGEYLTAEHQQKKNKVSAQLARASEMMDDELKEKLTKCLTKVVVHHKQQSAITYSLWSSSGALTDGSKIHPCNTWT